MKKIDGILLGRMRKPLSAERFEVIYEYQREPVTRLGNPIPLLKEPEIKGVVEFQKPKRLYCSKGNIKILKWIKSGFWLKRIFGIKELIIIEIKNCCFKRKNSKTINFYKGKKINILLNKGVNK